METTAVKEGDHYILNGQKTWISLCDTADHFLVFAYTDKSKKHHGISAFIVERTWDGFASKGIEGKLCIRSGNTGEIFFDHVRGLSAFQEKAPFDASLLTHFRKRLGASIINQVNEWVVEAQSQQTKDQQYDDHDDDDSHGGAATDDTPASQPEEEDHAESSSHQGKLLIDATCASADITYPTDLGLLNGARKKLEKMIDTLLLSHQGKKPKPRTYRKKARKAYLAVAKQRNPRRKTLRKAVGKQLNFVARDLKHVETLVHQDGLKSLSNRQYRYLLVIQELFRQQKIMHKTRTHRIDSRIVSISQPHVRPIVRGKTGANVEFGPKLSVRLVNGFSFLDKLGWNAYHEGNDLRHSIEAYHRRYGVYPEAVLARPNLPDSGKSGLLQRAGNPNEWSKTRTSF